MRKNQRFLNFCLLISIKQNNLLYSLNIFCDFAVKKSPTDCTDFHRGIKTHVTEEFL